MSYDGRREEPPYPTDDDKYLAGVRAGLEAAARLCNEQPYERHAMEMGELIRAIKPEEVRP